MNTENDISIIFIYQKEGKIKCLTIKDELIQREKLISDSWHHVSTIDACLFIESLANVRKIDLQL